VADHRPGRDLHAPRNPGHLPRGPEAPLSQHDWDYARIGLRYEFSPQLQVYGNLSRSVEPPHAWSMIWGSNSVFRQRCGQGPGPRRRPEKPDRHHP
jgi:outer membrane receptor protein involved in Fe transport